MIPKESETYLGLDLSTQKLKAIVLDAKLKMLVSAEVKFDSDLPEFRTTGGANSAAGKQEFYVQPVMWVKAVDMVLDRLVVQGADFSKIAAVSGSAQQHGSLYWSKHGVNTLKNLDSDKFLHTQIDDSAFTVTRTPIWMDGTTTKQCIEMEEGVGGRDIMVELTGSKCYERFTGPQIRKVFQSRPDSYRNTERISLVSSFLASLFLEDISPIDYTDGSGMNLLNIHTKKWSDECLNACAPDLDIKLGNPVSPNSIVGNIGNFFVQRYGFDTECKIIPCTGDNPSALSGMVIGDNWLAISLGTSDTVMMELTKPPKLQEGHILVHPTYPDHYMGLLCFRNGSLVRDTFKRSEANDSWVNFSELLNSTPRGNFGNIALHFYSQEIMPDVKGSLRWNKSSTASIPELGKGVIKYGSPQAEIRALIEGQMLHKKAVACDMGFSFGEDTRILATGGASANRAILQVMSDVFNAPVYIQKTTEAASLGAAYRAKYGLYLHSQHMEGPAQKYDEYIRNILPNTIQRVCDPSKDSQDVYDQMLLRYREMASYMLNAAKHE